MAKINKNKTHDVFSGVKYVDRLLNEAAGIKSEPKKKLSFEEKMKLKLKEGAIDETAEMTEDTLEEYNGQHPYGYNYDANNEFLGEEGEMEEDFMDPLASAEIEHDSEEDIFGDDDEFGDELSHEPEAERMAARDMESEFGMEEPEEHEVEREFDFTEDEELMEALLSEADPALDTADDTTIPPAMDAGAEAMGAPAGVEDGVAPIEATPTEGEPEMGADMGGDLGGAPMGGAAPMGAEPAGMEAPAAGMETSPVNEPEDIDQLIADLVKGTGHESEEQPAVFGEAKEKELDENELKDLGYTDLKDQDIVGKVKMESKETKEKEALKKKEAEAKEKKADKKKEEVKEGEIKMTKLGDEDITGNVKGASTGEEVHHKGEGDFVSPEGHEFTSLGAETVDSNKVKDTKVTKIDVGQAPKFDALKKENEQKTQALYTLAEKVITLEDEIANLKFAKFKLEKVNSILSLLPELKLETREKLVSKFGEAKTYAEAKKLYTEVAEMVKDHKRGSINEAVLKNKKSTKYFTEGVEDFGGDESEDKETARRNMLMGLKGYDDSYGTY